MENRSFSFSAPVWTRGGNYFLARVDWCPLEPVFHFLLDSKQNLSCLTREVGVYVWLNLKQKSKEDKKRAYEYAYARYLTLTLFSSERTKTQCETHRDSLLGVTEFGPRGPRPPVGQYIPTCDENGAYEPMQCHGSTGHCWCVDRNGQEIPGTRSGPGSRPMCE